MSVAEIPKRFNFNTPYHQQRFQRRRKLPNTAVTPLYMYKQWYTLGLDFFFFKLHFKGPHSTQPDCCGSFKMQMMEEAMNGGAERFPCPSMPHRTLESPKPRLNKGQAASPLHSFIHSLTHSFFCLKRTQARGLRWV